MAQWRIKNISIENFKFFKDSFTLDINRKNLLLYGENGSGKSSIYWSFYTHFQAYSKNQEQAGKYFQHGHNENLRNRYSSSDENSGITISFDNGEGSTLSITDSNNNFYCNDPTSKEFMRMTMMSSDFMNYKFLSSLFDFCNSEENEVFKMFEKEVLPFIDLDIPFNPIDGSANESLNSGDWWNYLVHTYKLLPRNHKNYNSFNQRTPEYKAFNILLKQFNDLLKDALVIIEGIANTILKNSFHIESRIKLEYRNATFNIPKGPRSRDGKLHAPKILIHAKMDDPNLKDHSLITHPKSFFNEAKITCMALALRLSILERKACSSYSASILFIDDLLISLDMAFRKHVIKILLATYSPRYQIILLTHDRAFFHLVWSEIENSNQTKSWIKSEIYTSHNGTHPFPILITSPSYLERAKIYLKTFQVAACANTLRKLCEQQLKRILPLCLQIQVNERESDKVMKDLNGLIDMYKIFVKQCNMPNIAPSLHNDRKLILNPFSHDDIDTPFYRQELENLIIELEELSKIKKEVIIGYNDIRLTSYQITVVNNDHSHSATIEFLEAFYKFEFNGKNYYSNPKVKVISSTDNKRIELKTMGINHIFSKVYNAVSYNAKNAPSIETCLFDMQNKLLIN